MKGDKEREEICKTRKDAGLNCNGCQYKEKCQGEKVGFVLPEDIKPGTKQAKIYWELKSGKTAAEIIKTKEFASESVYIVARKHFPDAITKNGSARTRLKKAAGKVIDKENYFGKSEIPEKAMETENEIKAKEEPMEFVDKKEPEPAPEKKEDPVEKLEKMERVIRNAEKREELKKRAVEWLRAAIEKLEAGELVKCRTAIAYAIGLLEKEVEK